MSEVSPTVVGIGASAGGLAALKTLLSHFPGDCGLALVVVVHLSPDHESHLAQLLQPSAKFPVQQVTETVPMEANHVYVIPPNANLSAIDTHLRLSPLEPVRQERAPIDHFFRTLAKTHDGRSVAVVLTGTGSDGTLGIRDIKANGGVVIVQDPNQAEYDNMPQSAITTGIVDLILPVEQIPEAILRYQRTEPRISLPEHDDEVPQTEHALLQKIFAQLLTKTDRNFSHYKRATLLRRIARRMQLNYIEDLEHYLEHLSNHPDEVRALADDLLITVTHFFRDADVFQKLETEVIPRLFQNKGPRDFVRVWSVGCATGEEAYSLAILLVNEAGKHEDPPLIQVFASDLHTRSLERAREGFYPGDIATDVSEERLRRFFHKENGGYRIRKELRDLVVFSPHNILVDPPFSRQDLISCRNVLIYLDREVQRDVIELFHYALNPEGTLLLGSAESIDSSDLFRVDDKKLCLFIKRNVPPRDPRLPVFPLTFHRSPFEGASRTLSGQEPIAYGRLHQQMVEQYAPPSILVSPDNKLIHLSEHAGRYLVHPGGELTASVFKLLREELRIELQASLQMARENKQPFDSLPITVKFDGQPMAVVIHVRPALERTREGLALVIFEERQPVSPSTVSPDSSTKAEVNAQIISTLENELSLSRQRLQSVIEEYETSQEEMKASSEEMQSTNEELRSTLEELETSKEELQSINEELQTVNQQNRHKVEELAQLSSDLQNLLSATDIATLFLDRELRILRFTPKLGNLFNVRIADRGRPFSDLTHRLGYQNLKEDAETVLETLIPIEREVQDDRGAWFLTRILPYRSTENRIEGIVITFIDIDSRKRAVESLRASEEFLRLANHALVRANDDLKHFSYAVSHDMQEPLRMVLVFTQLLERDYGAQLDDKARMYTGNAVNGARRMEALLNDLREYWSVDDESTHEAVNVNCETVLDRVMSLLSKTVEESGAVITREPLPTIQADMYSLTLLFQNLISNAIKYRRRETVPRIRVSAYRSDSEWTFSVEDNGIGIDDKSLALIFSPFKRLHGREFQGTGLGLALCRKIVERYHGRIWTESIVGQGSSFRFTMPIKEDPSHEPRADSADRGQSS